MIIHCVELGTHYWLQKRYDEDGFYVPSRSCYFNSTGFPRRDDRTGLPVSWVASLKKKVHRCWSVAGLVRFNAEGFPWYSMPIDLNGVNVMTKGIEIWNSQKRLLFTHAVRKDANIDAFLVVVRSAVHGRIDFKGNWRTAGVRVVCASADKGRQETLILMPPTGTITTDSGRWQIKWNSSSVAKKRARLELIDEPNEQSRKG
jgi:hypothetical protein